MLPLHQLVRRNHKGQYFWIKRDAVETGVGAGARAGGGNYHHRGSVQASFRSADAAFGDMWHRVSRDSRDGLLSPKLPPASKVSTTRVQEASTEYGQDVIMLING